MENQNTKDKDLPIMEHLVELRDRFIRSGIAIILTTSVCFYFANDIWEFLVEPLNKALEETL